MSYHLNGFYSLTYHLCQFVPLKPCWHLEISPISLRLLTEFWLWRSHHLEQRKTKWGVLLRVYFMLWFQNPKVNKMELAALHFLFGGRWTLQAAFLVCFLFPSGVTDPVVLLSFTFLSKDECEREYWLSKDIRPVG